MDSGLWIRTRSSGERCLAPGLMEALIPGEDEDHGSTTEVPRGASGAGDRSWPVDARRDPVSRPGACGRIGEQLGINAETLRGWVVQAEVDGGHRPGVASTDAARLRVLERE